MCPDWDSKEVDDLPLSYTNRATIRVHVSVLEETSEMSLNGLGE